MFDLLIDNAWEFDINKFKEYNTLLKSDPDNVTYAVFRNRYEKEMTQSAVFKIMISEEDRDAINAILAKYEI